MPFEVNETLFVAPGASVLHPNGTLLPPGTEITPSDLGWNSKSVESALKDGFLTKKMIPVDMQGRSIPGADGGPPIPSDLVDEDGNSRITARDAKNVDERSDRMQKASKAHQGQEKAAAAAAEAKENEGPRHPRDPHRDLTPAKNATLADMNRAIKANDPHGPHFTDAEEARIYLSNR